MLENNEEESRIIPHKKKKKKQSEGLLYYTIVSCQYIVQYHSICFLIIYESVAIPHTTGAHFEASDEGILTTPKVLSCILFYHPNLDIGTVCLTNTKIKGNKPFSMKNLMPNCKQGGKNGLPFPCQSEHRAWQ